MDFDAICAQLKKRLSQPLPGIDAHKKMAPPERFPNGGELVPELEPRIGCVLLLLYPDHSLQTLKFPLIVRPEYKGVHSGQVAFPGGKQEEVDEDLIATALRETAEEIGVSIERSQVLGQLSQVYIPPSNFMVYPVVAAISQKPNYAPSVDEVAKIFEVSVAHIYQHRARSHKNVTYKQREFLMPFYDIGGNMIWGATAMIISEFVEIWDDIQVAC
ncbi:NUDIX hydrolase [Eisenibacter elegans]|jgi:8-oxo-dGTP pyrophosphatase MutT (NUDIX family)|uniref:NUDIX hydrolase n=1 Tax=Eisenibacter elegans TaxID=997 RepID=UPI00041496FE|nr:CoA pyrophosphatase [Eisenibacter elegans]